MPRAKLSSVIRRDQIAEATLAEVSRHGLQRLSVAAVAGRVGLSPAALYRHYASKDAVLDAVLERLRERLHSNVAAVRAEFPDPVDALRELQRRHMRLLRENSAMPLLLFNDAFHAGHPERRARVLAAFTGYLGGIAALLRSGQRRGLVRRDVSARALAVLFLGLVQPASVLSTLSEGTFDLTRQALAAWPVYEQAIRTRRARPRAPRRGRPTSRRTP